MMTFGVLRQFIDQATSVALLVHLKPDGDALGAAVALSLAFGKKVTTVTTAQVTEKGLLPLFKQLTFSSEIPEATDLVIVLDCADSNRTGYGQQLKKLPRRVPIIVIDHHKELGDLHKLTLHYLHSPDSSSTCEIIATYLFKANIKVTKAIATALLTGIITDSQGFRHAPDPTTTMNIASKLISCGAQHQQVIDAFLPNLTLKQRKIWGILLSSTTITPLGIVRAVITRETQERYQTSQEDLNGFITLLSLTHEARMAVLVIEEEKHWKVILKSRHFTVALNKIARIFDGVGKPRLAVFRVTKSAFSSKILG